MHLQPERHIRAKAKRTAVSGVTARLLQTSSLMRRLNCEVGNGRLRMLPGLSAYPLLMPAPRRTKETRLACSRAAFIEVEDC
jgi:hypothetical protein